MSSLRQLALIKDLVLCLITFHPKVSVLDEKNDYSLTEGSRRAARIRWGRVIYLIKL